MDPKPIELKPGHTHLTGTDSTSGLPKEVWNRIFVWQSALENAVFNLKAATTLFCLPIDPVSFEWDGKPCQVNPAVQGTVATRLVALVLFCQMYMVGKAGPGLVANKDSAALVELNAAEKYASGKLQWSEEKFSQYIKQIREKRDKLVAHYDGDAADYREHSTGVISMKIVGGNFNEPEAEQLEAVILLMYEYFDSILFPQKQKSSPIKGQS